MAKKEDPIEVTISPANNLDMRDMKAVAINALIFTAPALAVLFSLLAQGVPFSKAYPLALFSLYSLLADLFKKWKNPTIRMM